MYAADHNPPHFHVIGIEFRAQIEIETREVLAISGKMASRIRREVAEWAEEHIDFLRAKWEELQR